MNSAEEWYHALQYFATDIDARLEAGAAAYEVAAGRTYTEHAHLWHEVYARTLKQGPPAPAAPERHDPVTAAAESLGVDVV